MEFKMTNQDILKKMLDEYNELFNKDGAGLKVWNKKKRYAWAEIISGLELAIKYIFIFNNDGN